LQNRNNIANILSSYRENNNESQLFNKTSKDKLQTLDPEYASSTNRLRIKTEADIKISNRKYLVQNVNLKKTKTFLQGPFKKNLTQYLKVHTDKPNRCYTMGRDEL
jgi:hypothetical protein